MTEDLYNQKDVTRIRKKLLDEQSYKDACTKLALNEKDAVLDHVHDDNQFVRGVLHRQVNAVIGKIENFFDRFVSSSYDKKLPDFLRDVADYLEKQVPTRYRHPQWIAKTMNKFSRLTAEKQQEILHEFGVNISNLKNLSQRKKAFRKFISRKTVPATIIMLAVEARLNSQYERSSK